MAFNRRRVPILDVLKVSCIVNEYRLQTDVRYWVGSGKRAGHANLRVERSRQKLNASKMVGVYIKFKQDGMRC